MSQSSIEFLIEEVQKRIPPFYAFYIMHMDEVYEQAKEMHKQESIAAQMDMFHFLNNLPVGMQYLNKRENAEKVAEIYYNKTFNNNENGNDNNNNI